jgi:hypothetical protein
VKLRRGQRLLYELVCKTLAEGRPLMRREYVALYASKIRRCDIYARDYVDRTGKIVNEIRRPYYEDETLQAASAWVVRTLGSLVQIGALKVIPQIKVEDIE